MPFESAIFPDRNAILTSFSKARANSEKLAAPLSAEDWMLQSMPDASPVKWNLAHTSWFFETFILEAHADDYELFHPKFCYLFNSYYNQIGEMHPRPHRGMLSRPSAQDILDFRAHVNEAMTRLVETAPDDVVERIAPLVALGCAHEEQHQELLLTDLKHGLYQNPLLPAVYEEAHRETNAAPALEWREMEGGLCEIGWGGKGFAFDNEGPRHKVYLHPFRLANRPVTNAEFIEFIEDGAYQDAPLWLSDAWDLINRETLRAPLYWRKDGGEWLEYTLFGERPVNPHAPVCHISQYEAAAYAYWAGARLPTEFEWEAAASLFPVRGRYLENGAASAPSPAAAEDARLLQLYGDVWEWTASPYVAYPGYAPANGAIGEYNGKFMSGQMVLKGGSCATPEGHIRASYRNFFPASARWQFAGLRLARDCD